MSSFLRLDRPGRQLAQHANEEMGSLLLPFPHDSIEAVVLLDQALGRPENRAGIESGDHLVHGHGHVPLARPHLPEGRHHAAVGRESAGVDVDATEAGHGEDLLPEDLRGRDRDDDVRGERSHPLDEIAVVHRCRRLRWNARVASDVRDRTSLELQANEPGEQAREVRRPVKREYSSGCRQRRLVERSLNRDACDVDLFRFIHRKEGSEELGDVERVVFGNEVDSQWSSDGHDCSDASALIRIEQGTRSGCATASAFEGAQVCVALRAGSPVDVEAH